jgi:hypothetical protein
MRMIEKECQAATFLVISNLSMRTVFFFFFLHMLDLGFGILFFSEKHVLVVFLLSMFIFQHN